MSCTSASARWGAFWNLPLHDCCVVTPHAARWGLPTQHAAGRLPDSDSSFGGETDGMARPAASADVSILVRQDVHDQNSISQPQQWYTHCVWHVSDAASSASVGGHGRRVCPQPARAEPDDMVYMTGAEAEPEPHCMPCTGGRRMLFGSQPLPCC